MSEPVYSYEIRPRKHGGWMLVLLDNGVEVGGGIAADYDELYSQAQDWIKSRGKAAALAPRLRYMRARGWLQSADARGGSGLPGFRPKK